MGWFVATLLLSSVCFSAEEDTGLTLHGVTDEAEEARPYYWGIGLVNTYPGLASEDIIDRVVEPALNVLAPGFGGLDTFGDLRDEHLFLPPQITLGKVFGKHWAVGGHLGYSEGTVRNDKEQRSILFLLPFHLDLQVKRLAWYGGVDIDYYPFGRPELREYQGLLDRVKEAKFRVGATGSLTYSGYNAKIQTGLLPLGSLIKFELRDRWRLMGLCPNVGFDLPLGPRDMLSATTGYTLFNNQKQDFEGWNVTVNWRHFFSSFGKKKSKTGPLPTP